MTLRHRHLQLFFAVLLALASSMACALERVFPANSVQVKIQSFNDPYMVANGKTYHMPPGLLIYNANNTTIVRGALPVNIYARIQLDLNGDLRRIWILNPEEINTTSIRQQPAPTEQLQ